MRTDRRTGGKTDMTERMAAFRNFSYAPKTMHLDMETSRKDI